MSQVSCYEKILQNFVFRRVGSRNRVRGVTGIKKHLLQKQIQSHFTFLFNSLVCITLIYTVKIRY